MLKKELHAIAITVLLLVNISLSLHNPFWSVVVVDVKTKIHEICVKNEYKLPDRYTEEVEIVIRTLSKIS